MQHESSRSIPAEADLPLLQQYLADCSEPCPSCRYDLRQLRGEHCPECGQQLRLRVGLEHPNLGSYVAGVVALATAAGFNLLMFLFFTVATLVMGGARGSSIGSYLTATLIGGMISMPLLFAWLRWGGWFRRQSSRVRLGLVLLCWILPVLSLIGMLIVFLNE